MTSDPAMGQGDAEIVDLPTGQRRFSDSQVRRVAEVIASSSALAQVTAWETEDRKGPGGRPPKSPSIH